MYRLHYDMLNISFIVSVQRERERLNMPLVLQTSSYDMCVLSRFMGPSANYEMLMYNVPVYIQSTFNCNSSTLEYRTVLLELLVYTKKF